MRKHIRPMSTSVVTTEVWWTSVVVCSSPFCARFAQSRLTLAPIFCDLIRDATKTNRHQSTNDPVGHTRRGSRPYLRNECRKQHPLGDPGMPTYPIYPSCHVLLATIRFARRDSGSAQQQYPVHKLHGQFYELLLRKPNILEKSS